VGQKAHPYENRHAKPGKTSPWLLSLLARNGRVVPHGVV
jgi:hypothetical protein